MHVNQRYTSIAPLYAMQMENIFPLSLGITCQLKCDTCYVELTSEPAILISILFLSDKWGEWSNGQDTQIDMTSNLNQIHVTAGI